MKKLLKFKSFLFCICVYVGIKLILLYKSHGMFSLIFLSKQDKNDNFSIEDILITVKTSSKFYSSRLKYIHSTWYQFGKDQTYLVTDLFNEEISRLFDHKLISTKCNSTHGNKDLCCKLANELNLFYSVEKKYKWLCHVDDDNYINIPNLVKLLSNYDFEKPFYLGRLSWSFPVKRTNRYKVPEKSSFHFGTLGAGVCLSRKTMLMIKDTINDIEKFSNECDSFHIGDDMYLGYVLEWLHKIKLTQITKFNSHLDTKQFDNMKMLNEQVTLGFGHAYKKYHDRKCNCSKNILVVPKLKNIHSNSNDTLRMQTIHCILFPDFSNCKELLIDSLKT